MGRRSCDATSPLCARGGAGKLPFQMKPGIWICIWCSKERFSWSRTKYVQFARWYHAAAKCWLDQNKDINKDEGRRCSKEITGLPDDVDLNFKYNIAQFSEVNLLSDTCNWSLADIVTATNHYNGACANNYPASAGPYKSYQEAVCAAVNDATKPDSPSVCRKPWVIYLLRFGTS